MYVIWNECFIIKNKIAKHFHLQENVYFLALLLAGLLGLLSGDLHLTRWTIDGTLYDGGDESFLISSDWFLTTVRRAVTRAVKFTNSFLVSCCSWIKISWCLTNLIVASMMVFQLVLVLQVESGCVYPQPKEQDQKLEYRPSVSEPVGWGHPLVEVFRSLFLPSTGQEVY